MGVIIRMKNSGWNRDKRDLLTGSRIIFIDREIGIVRSPCFIGGLASKIAPTATYLGRRGVAISFRSIVLLKLKGKIGPVDKVAYRACLW